MSEVKETQVKITNITDISVFYDDLSVDEVRDMLSGRYGFIDSCVASEVIEDGVKVITFSESVGTKGLLSQI